MKSGKPQSDTSTNNMKRTKMADRRDMSTDRRNKPADNRQGSEAYLDNRTFFAIGWKMYMNTKTADVYFICDASDGQTERIPAHKAVLLLGSEKFEALFAKDSTQNEFTLAGTWAVVFKDFLRFFYFPKIRLTFQNIAGIVKLATSYGNEEIMKVCCEFVEQRSVDENLIWNYSLAIQADRAKMKRSCEKKIIIYAVDIFKTNDFLGCDRDVVSHILKLDGLICDEFEVLAACLSWAKATAVRKGLDSANMQVLREELGDLIFLIRFRSMNIQSFSSICGLFAGLFSGNEYEEIIQLIVNKEFVSAKFNNAFRDVANGAVGREQENQSESKADAKADAKPDEKANHKPEPTPDAKPEHDPTTKTQNEPKPKAEAKTPSGNKSWVFDRLLSTTNGKYYVRRMEKLRFMTNKPVLLTAFGWSQVLRQNERAPNVPSKITILRLENDKRDQVYAGQANLMSQEMVELEQPISIAQKVRYLIQLEQPSHNDFYNQLELKIDAELDDGFKVRIFGPDDPRTQYDQPKYGLITKLWFKQADASKVGE